MKLLKYILVFFLLSYNLSSSYAQKRSKKKKDLDQVFTEQQLVKLNRTFINANKEKLLGNYQQALNLFYNCVEIDPSHHPSYYEVAKIMARAGKTEDGLKNIKRAIYLHPENIWYQLLHAEILESKYDFKGAAKIFGELAKTYPDKIQYNFDHAAMLINTGNLNDAIKVYEEIENKIGITEDVSVQKERIYLRQNKVTKAANEIQKLIDAFPEEIRYYKMLAGLYNVNGRAKEAYVVYQKMVELAPNDPQTHLSLAEFYRTIGKTDSSFHELNMAFENPNLSVDTKIKILLPYYLFMERDTTTKDRIFDLAEILVKIHPEEAKTHALYGDFLYNDKQYDPSRKEYLTAIELDKEKFPIWQQLLAIDVELNDYKSLLEHSQEALTYFPNQAIIYFFNSIAKIQTNKYEEAISTIKTGLKITVDNPALMSQFYSNLGDAYNKIKKVNESDSAYIEALKIEPNNAHVLNNYSYYLSLRDDDLQKAEKMSFRANKLDPNNSSFQDTYGWIMFKQGKFEDAKYWLKKAFDNGGEKSAVVNEHYGDALYQLGEKEEAIKFWKKAKETGKGSELLDKKINEKKYISK